MGQNNTVVLAALVLTSLSLGFWAGTKSMSNSRSKAVSTARPAVRVVESSAEEGGNESDDSDSSVVADGNISAVRVHPLEECKMVFVVRTDLGMSSGKIAAQCSHAALACYKTLLTQNPTLLRHWERTGRTKVALRCAGEEKMLLVQAQAQSLNLCARSIQDAGRTQIAAGSRTVLGITGPTRLIEQVTGGLHYLDTPISEYEGLQNVDHRI